LENQNLSKCKIKAVPINSITRTCSFRRYGVGHIIPSAFTLHSNIDKEKERENSVGKKVIKLFILERYEGAHLTIENMFLIF
jgi:hypothetical protein